MSLQGVLPFVLDFFPRKRIDVEVSHAQLSGDAGLLPIRQFDEAIRLTERFATALTNARIGSVHSNLSMTRQRIFGILADYEDQNDHDALRSDPVFKLVCDRAGRRRPGQSADAVAVRKRRHDRRPQTSAGRAVRAVPRRLRRAPVPHHARHRRLRRSRTRPAAVDRVSRLLRAVPVPADRHHLHETDMVALVGLRHGTCAAFLGADDDLRYLVRRIRERFPDVEIVVRGDSGFGVPLMYDVCAELGMLKRELAADQLSDHRFVANFFRL